MAAPVQVAGGDGARGARRRRAGVRGHRRRLGQAGGRRARSTIRASSAATRWRARRRAGVEHARADLFAGRDLVPDADRRTRMGTAFERLHRLITRIGAWPSAIEPDTHDVVMASVSHLPHVLANVLVAQAARVLSARGRAAARDRPVVPRRHPRGGRELGRSGAASTAPTPTRWWPRSTTWSRG